MRNGIAISTLVLTLSFISPAFAVQIAGHKLIDIVISKPSVTDKASPNTAATSEIKTQKIALLRLHFTPKERKTFLAGLQNKQVTDSYNPPSSNSHLPTSIDLGMNGVPVFNQGQHGTCATFSATAAINALMGRGDYISQLCLLQLGSYLEQRSYLPSGWDGSWGSTVLTMLTSFGMVNKQTQKTQTCGGLSDYPLDEAITGSPMSLDDYKRISEDLSNKISWYPLLTPEERMEWDPNDSANGKRLLAKVKKVLATQGSRVLFGVGLAPEFCIAGACARYHKLFDTWAITDDMREDIDSLFDEMGGHGMVIIGYNDHAIVVDDNGKKHKGILILRNSWGPIAGDNGNYYMTYDYFMQFVLDAYAISLA